MHLRKFFGRAKWEAPQGSRWRTYEEVGRGQAFVRLPSAATAPRRVRLRVISFSEPPADSTAPGPCYQMTCVGELKFTSMRYGLPTAELFYRAPAWPPGLSRRHDQVARGFAMWTADPIDAILKADWSEEGAAAARASWPAAEMR